MGNGYLAVKYENWGLTKVFTQIWSKFCPIWPSAKSVTRPDFSNGSKDNQPWSKEITCLLAIILYCRQCHNIRSYFEFYLHQRKESWVNSLSLSPDSAESFRFKLRCLEAEIWPWEHVAIFITRTLGLFIVTRQADLIKQLLGFSSYSMEPEL